MSGVFLAHLAEALRAHRQHLGAARVPGALLQLEAEIWATALSGAERQPSDELGGVGHAARVLYTTSEVAEILALSERKVRDLRAAGRLRAIVIDRSVRFRVSDVNAFAAQNKEK